MTRPWRRISVGCYAAEIDGETVVFRRDGTRGFLLILGKGSLSKRCQRLRDAYALAKTCVKPTIFDVMEEDYPRIRGGLSWMHRPFDLARDMPRYLRRAA